MSKQKEIDQQIESIEGMVRALESAADPDLRASARDLVQALMRMHGVCLERMLEIVAQAGALGQTVIESFARDEKVRSLLLLYDLHPLSLETRILQALEKTRPYLRSHGGNVELVGFDDAGVVTLRLAGNCDGCPSSAETLKLAVENAIYEAAPDVTAIRVEGAIQEKSTTIGFVPLANLQNGGDHLQSNPEVEWEEVGGLDSLASGMVKNVDVAGQKLVFCKLEAIYYGYSNVCPGCGQPLGTSNLQGSLLTCAVCGQKYDVVHAGRGVDLDHLHLIPIPLLVENGRARIAVDVSRIHGSAK